MNKSKKLVREESNKNKTIKQDDVKRIHTIFDIAKNSSGSMDPSEPTILRPGFDPQARNLCFFN